MINLFVETIFAISISPKSTSTKLASDFISIVMVASLADRAPGMSQLTTGIATKQCGKCMPEKARGIPDAKVLTEVFKASHFRPLWVEVLLLSRANRRPIAAIISGINKFQFGIVAGSPSVRALRTGMKAVTAITNAAPVVFQLAKIELIKILIILPLSAAKYSSPTIASVGRAIISNNRTPADCCSNSCLTDDTVLFGYRTPLSHRLRDWCLG